MLLMGVVKEIREADALISLPNNLTGFVEVDEVSRTRPFSVCRVCLWKRTKMLCCDSGGVLQGWRALQLHAHAHRHRRGRRGGRHTPILSVRRMRLLKAQGFVQIQSL